jgi:hypothetical protein
MHKKLKTNMNSPLKRRTQARGISPQLAEYISSAGRDIVNEQVMKEVGGVGMALGAAFELAKEEKEKIEKNEKESQQFSVGAEDFIKNLTKGYSNFGKNIIEGEEEEKNVDYAKIFAKIGSTPGPFQRKTDGESNSTASRTFVEKEQTLSAPSFLTSGALAGYNETVERRNYKKQVEADYQNYLNQEFSAFETDATGYNTIDVSLQDAMKTAQVELYDLLKKPVSDRDLNWNLKYNQLRNSAKQSNAAGKNLAKAIGKIKEEMPNIDMNAVNPQDRDIWHSIISSSVGKGGLGFSWAKGDLSLLGSTNGKQPFKISVKDLAAGKLPIKFYRAQNPNADIEDFMEKAEKITRTYERNNLGTTTLAVAEDKVRQAAKSNYTNIIEDEDTLRGYASKVLGYDYDAFNEAKKRNLNIKDLVISKMADSTIDKMGMYFQQRQMTKGNKPSGDGQEAENYDILVNKILDPSTIQQYNMQNFPPEFQEESAKNFPAVTVFKGSPDVSDVDYNPKTGILTINPIRTVKVADGKQTVTTKTPIKIDFNQDENVLKGILTNLLKEYKINPSAFKNIDTKFVPPHLRK